MKADKVTVEELNDNTESLSDDDVTELLSDMRDRAILASEFWEYTYETGRADVDFAVRNKQWDARVLAERNLAGRPSLTMNKLRKHMKQVINDIRQRRPSIHYSIPKHVAAGEKISTESDRQIDLAELYEGLVRKDEEDCGAEAHYDRAFQHAIEAGCGWLRVLTEYEDETFDQRTKITSLRNRWGALLDPAAEEPDFSDSRYGFVFEDMPRKDFLKEYPDAILGEVSSSSQTFKWLTTDTVRVVEYFTRDREEDTLLLLSDGTVTRESKVKDVLDDLRRGGVKVERRRKIEVWVVRWHKATAWSLLEGPKVWPGSTIPLVPVLGEAVDLEDVTFYRSLVHDAKDEQRAHNFWMTSATERVALSPKAPWVGTQEQFRGHPEWDDANTKNYSKLTYNPDPSAPGPPRREQPAPIPAAELTMAQSFEQGIMSTLGRYEASVGQRSNETSGKAIMARAQESDQGSFNFVDNLARAMRRIGIIEAELIPQIFDSERRVTIKSAEGSEDSVVINKVVRDTESGRNVIVHDMASSTLTVVVKASKSSDSMRMEVVEALTEVARTVPSIGALVTDVIAANMDWPGAKQLADRIRRSLPPQVLSDEERKDMGIDKDQGPNPEQQMEMAKMESEVKKEEISLEIAKIKLQEAQAKASQLQGQGADQIRKIVAEAMAELLSQQQAPMMQA